MKDIFILQGREDKKGHFKNKKAWSCKRVGLIKKMGYLMEYMVHGGVKKADVELG